MEDDSTDETYISETIVKMLETFCTTLETFVETHPNVMSKICFT